MMGVAETIANKLHAAIAPARVVVTDDSHRHAGHAGARPGGETHFTVLIVASAFEGLSRVARQRMVNAILKEELAGQIHALAMRTLTPEEAAHDESAE